MPYNRFSIRLPERYHESLTRLLMEQGCIGTINQPDFMIAYFPLTVDPRSVSRELEIWKSLMQSQAQGFQIIYEQSILPDADWNESWKRGFRPMDIGSRFTIMPPWEIALGNRIPLIIDPGMAFGTGHHGTTRSCLIMMERYVDRVGKHSFLDLGTGTGLLALAALKLGFQRVVAIDTDPLSIDAARRNFEQNSAEQIVLREGGITSARGPYDMIAANLISGTLVALASDLAQRLKNNGVSILSGILPGQEKEVLEAMGTAGLGLSERIRDGKWITLAVKR